MRPRTKLNSAVFTSLVYSSILSSLFFFSSNALASVLDVGEWDHEVGYEWRTFNESGTQGQAKNSVSMYYQPEVYWESEEGLDSFTFQPFFRWDQNDSERTHFDIRDAYWTHVGDWWETKIGITSVYWGKTEFTHLVDIVNQKDAIEGGTGDARLGQPMLNASFVFDKGILDVFVLGGFRETTFAGEGGRLRTPLLVDNADPRFDNQLVRGLDFAIRWEQPIGDYWEVAVSEYNGLSRSPSLGFNFDFFDSPAFFPLYEQINQIGFEAEFIYEGLIWKTEGVSVSGQVGGRWEAISTGVEYTFGNLFGTGHDITSIVEYVYDSRAADAPHFLERDIAVGLRWAANDEQDTSALLGVFYDPDTKEKVAVLEASRRIGESWTIKLSSTFVVVEGEQVIDDNLNDAFNSLLANPMFVGAEITEEARLFLASLFFDYTPAELVNIFNGALNDQLLGTLQSLQAISDFDSKLSFLDNDDFVQVELVHYF
ncbi:MAG: hypothetical protein KUG82_19830 [Pseudomonadales bacterium]|nr:hypothetical protein [Pseudomonadales bacterium]